MTRSPRGEVKRVVLGEGTLYVDLKGYVGTFEPPPMTIYMQRLRGQRIRLIAELLPPRRGKGKQDGR